MIKYGGHVLDTQGSELVVKPDPEKLERLRAFPRPNNAKEIQSLIGVIKTFERWNFSLSAKCEKIRELGKKDNSFMDFPGPGRVKNLFNGLLNTSSIKYPLENVSYSK